MARTMDLLVAPDASRSVERLAGALPPDWDVDLVRDPMVEGPDAGSVLRAAAQQRRLSGHDVAVCLTDLPLGGDRRPLVALCDRRHNAALVSLPALGVTRQVPRAARIVHEVAAGLLQDDGPVELGLRRGLGQLRLLVGLVRANRPWRLAAGLTGALAAGVSTAAFGILSPTPWQLALAMGPLRLAVVTCLAVTTMVGFLIVGHGLWERGDDLVREHVRLYNATTVVTLALGVLCLYAVGFGLVLPVVWLVLDASVVAANVGPRPGFPEYATIGWFITSMATVGGALGSALESDSVVREAAYGQRQRRRAERQAEAQRNG